MNAQATLPSQNNPLYKSCSFIIAGMHTIPCDLSSSFKNYDTAYLHCVKCQESATSWTDGSFYPTNSSCFSDVGLICAVSVGQAVRRYCAPLHILNAVET